jgi:hypothetical protein
MEFAETVVSTRSGERAALVAWPTEDVVVGRERLGQLRASGQASSIDHEILSRVRAAGDHVNVLIFRGRAPEGRGRYSVDPDLSDEERAELGYLLVFSQTPTYRRFLAAGILAFLHVELFGATLDAFRSGTERMLNELERNVIEIDPAVRAVDTWVLKHLSFYFSLGLDSVLERILPDKMPLFESREPRIREMLTRLPPAAIQ